jgi:uncharacterized membrane protein YraQ (UPF0718 family)
MWILLQNAIDIWTEAAPWLIFGLIVAGALKVWFPTAWVQRWLGGDGAAAVVKAALIGTPIPLCSCSVLPAAITLRRSGASKGATVSFLIATPENGADSLAVSYALLGPVMTIARPLAAVASAITAGLMTSWTTRNERDGVQVSGEDGSTDLDQSAGFDQSADLEGGVEHCCADGSEHGQDAISARSTIVQGMRFAAVDLMEDIIVWLLVGIVLAAVVRGFASTEWMTQWGSGLPAMLVMLLVAMPMYICATASTPVAAALLLAGISPGTVLVFLLAGPATNVGSLGIVRRELGTAATISYLVGVCGVAIIAGLLFDGLMEWTGIDVSAQAAATSHLVPPWLAVTSAIVLAVLAVRALLVKAKAFWAVP